MKRFLILFCFAAMPLFADDGRLRCPEHPPTQAKCEEVRVRETQRGCIDEATYSSLRAENRFPCCIDATYLGSCPCEVLTGMGIEGPVGEGF